MNGSYYEKGLNFWKVRNSGRIVKISVLSKKKLDIKVYKFYGFIYRKCLENELIEGYGCFWSDGSVLYLYIFDCY